MEQSTPAERLMSLFATNSRTAKDKPVRRKTNGLSRFCFYSGVDMGEASRWRSMAPSGKKGRIPPSFNTRIIEAVDKAGIPRTALIGILDAATCPMCGQPVGVGHSMGDHR